MSIQDITSLLIDRTYKVLEWRIHYAMNEMDKLPKGYLNFNHKALDEIVKLTEPLLKNAQLTKKIDAESTKSILDQLNSGKITTDEAVKLMKVMKSKTEVEEREAKLDIQKKISSIVNAL